MKTSPNLNFLQVYQVKTSLLIRQFLLFFFLCLNCTNEMNSSFSSDDTIQEGKARPELFTIAFLRCIETGGSSTKALEVYVIVDKLFSKSAGSQSQRDSITYKKTDFENCRNNLLIYPIKECDFKPFDIANFISDKALCNLEPTSFFQF
ncbi:MAG: hypothetical protein CK427_09780 [Leptospira sp.]|nr:MAG: hypothetical protein CK427_09780 [Leptospira sp.]